MQIQAGNWPRLRHARSGAGKRYTLEVRMLAEDLSGRVGGGEPSTDTLELRETNLPDEPVDLLLSKHAEALSKALDAMVGEPLTPEEENDPAVIALRARFGSPRTPR